MAGLVDISEEDEINYFEVLPVEILSKIDDPLQLFSCSQTCSTFENILEGTKTSFLFALALPSLTRHLTNSDLLNCRLVSKSWLRVVDKFRQSDVSSPSFDVNFTDEINPITGFHWESEFPASNLTKFMDDMKDHSGNPFPTRALIYDDSWREFDYKDEEFHAFLNKFGMHVWHLTFKTRSISEYYDHTHIPQVLGSLPNLRNFTFYGEFYDYEYAPRPLNILQVIPDLPHLKRLIIPKSTYDRTMWRFVGKYADQLTSLECSSDQLLFADEHKPNKTLVFPNLTSLKLQENSGDDSYPAIRTFNLLGEVERFARLKKLALRFRKDCNEEYQPLLKAIGVLAQVLDQLHIQILPNQERNYENDDMSEIERLHGYSENEREMVNKLFQVCPKLKRAQIMGDRCGRLLPIREYVWDGTCLQMILTDKMS